MATIVGGGEIKLIMNKALKADVTAAIRRGLKTIGMEAESYAKDLCPVDTGNLSNSITYALDGDTTLLVGTNVEYAPYVELGHYQQPGRYVPALGKRLVASYVPAHPFIRPAMENHMAEYNAIMIDELNGENKDE